MRIIRLVIVSPSKFYKNDQRATDLKWSFGIVLATALASILGSIYAFTQVIDTFPSAVRAFAILGGLVTLFEGIFGTFLVWFAFAGTFYFLSMPFGGNGDFRDLLAAIGWGFIPSGIGAFIGSVSAIYVFSQVPLRPVGEGLTQATQATESNPWLVLANVLGVPFAVWQGFLWFYAVKSIRGLSSREAIITVAGPVAVSISWSLWNIV